MDTKSFFGKLEELKLKFDKFCQHRKMIKAILNHSYLKELTKPQIQLVKCVQICLTLGFLKPYQEDFLSGLLKEFDIFYLDWCYRTKALKEKAGIPTAPKKEKKIKTRIVVEQTYFDFDKPSIEIPVHILPTGSNLPSLRA